MPDGIGFGIQEVFQTNTFIMFKNNFILAFRLLKRQRVYSAINLVGLSLGMACFLIIVLFFQYQKSYDQFHSKKDQIFRVNRLMNEQFRFSNVPSKIGESVKGNVTEVEQVLRLNGIQTQLHYGDKGFSEYSLYAADNSFFNVFDFELLSGDPSNSLSALNSIVLNETLTKKYFGDEPPLGKIISAIDKKGKKLDLKVTGILKDLPPNTHLMINALLSYSTLKQFYSKEQLENDNCITFVQLNESADPIEIEKQISDLVLHQISVEAYKTAALELQPITEIFFNPSKNGGSQMGNEVLTDILLLIGIFILLIASLNYVNLATARSLKRSKEVGIRKVSGANKKQLVFQFIGESVFFCIASLLVALILVNIFIPAINDYSSLFYKINLDPYFFFEPQFMLIAISSAIVTGLLSGLYPAFVISSFNPSKSLKGELEKRRKVSTKKVLVVAQYVVSIFLVICCITIYKVFDHMKNQDFGFDKENILAVNIGKLHNPAEITELKNKIKWMDGIVNVAGASKIPLSHRDDLSGLVYDNKTDAKKYNQIIYIDEDYFELLEIEIKQSIHPLENDERIENGIYVNEVFMNNYGDQYALGDPVEVYEYSDADKMKFTSSVNGIVKDFKTRILEPNLQPAIIKIDEHKLNYLLVKLQPENQHESIALIESTFKKQFPDLAFEFTFVDDEMNAMFSLISPFSHLIYYATFFAIFIASMGLFALALFVTQQRTKEIGIRKIFGSSEMNISFLLAGQFIKLILVSFIIAGPLTFYGFRWLLMKFPDKIELSWSLLFMVGAGLILLAMITVMGQSWKAAKANPVETLRYE